MRIRLKTWYWGKYIVAAKLPSGPDSKDWEEYSTTVHGAQHSEEVKSGLYTHNDESQEYTRQKAHG